MAHARRRLPPISAAAPAFVVESENTAPSPTILHPTPYNTAHLGDSHYATRGRQPAEQTLFDRSNFFESCFGLRFRRRFGALKNRHCVDRPALHRCKSGFDNLQDKRTRKQNTSSGWDCELARSGSESASLFVEGHACLLHMAAMCTGI